MQRLAHHYYRQAEIPETRIAHYDDIFHDRDDVQYGTFLEGWTFSVAEKRFN